MLHRHLNHQRYTLAAIDDVIARGRRHDWIELRRAALSDPLLMTKVLQVCAAHVVRSPRAALPFLEALCRTTPCLTGNRCVSLRWDVP